MRIRQIAAALYSVLMVGTGVVRADDVSRIVGVSRPPTTSTNAFYVSNRAPLEPSPFCKLPIGSITPQGWLRHMLEIEAAGMTGHLPEINEDCQAEGNAWMSPLGEGHSTWESVPYWLKGFGDLGYVLRDERIMAEMRPWIEGLLASQQADGWFGPAENKTRLRGKSDAWPNMLALNVLQSCYEFGGDKRILECMTRYFRWQLTLPESDFLVPDWQSTRAGDNLESVYWLYNRTGEAWLLELAGRIQAHADKWSEGIPNFHGVNFAQCFRQPAIYWMQARDPKFREAAYLNYDTYMGEFGQQPGGMYGADENARVGYTDPRQAAETCAIVEYMHSFEMLVKITGDPLWADRCEEVAFNSFPAAQPPDQKGLHYLTAANLPQIDPLNHSPGIGNGGTMFGYNPYSYGCCQHNVAMGWPYYAEELWLATPDNGLCASLYAACEVEARVGDGTAVKLSETTDYPFDGKITFVVTTPRSVRFPLYLRIPRWCDGAELRLNGKALKVQAAPLSFLMIERTWTDRDQLVLTLPMRLAVRVWEKNKNAVSVDRGPLTYSLKIGEQWERYGGTDSWPCLQVLPTTPWNYGLEVDPARPERSIKVVRKRGPLSPQPFTVDSAPIELLAKARKIPQWTFDTNGLCAVLQASPALTKEPLETVTLIPMGCARLRISAFPVASTSSSANPWAETPHATNALFAYASFSRADGMAALCDGSNPTNSNDHAISRFTWWPRHGTSEWVAYRYSHPQTFTQSDVYWYDDTEGNGGCRVPTSWRLLYKEGNEWNEVQRTAGSGYGTERDTSNVLTFTPVVASEFRMEVQLQPDYSGGILRWTMGADKK